MIIYNKINSFSENLSNRIELFSKNLANKIKDVAEKLSSIIESDNNDQNEYLDQKNKDICSNINEFSINQSVLDKDGSKCEITNMTKSSIEVLIKKKGKRGIDCKQWFFINNFNKRFNSIKMNKND
jgi:hypothetical protein